MKSPPAYTLTLASCHFTERKSEINRQVICQAEYEEVETLIALHCKHPFHAECISTWLQIKKVLSNMQ